MNKVTAISYHGTGSSAVDDYLREFSDMCFPKRREIECRFFHDPDGISDLEYNLIDNWNRLNSGFALKKFKKFAKFYNHTYSMAFKENWLKCVNEYINELADFEFRGYWHEDIRILPFAHRTIYKFRRGLSKLMPGNLGKPYYYNYFPGLKTYHSKPTREEFYKATQDFCDKLCASVANESDEYFIMDQAVPTTNIARYLNYIPDLKVIIVERDPRDVYVQEMIAGNHVLSVEPEYFARQFVDSRSTVNEELKNPNVIRIQFEDLIYKYEETTKTIREFIGLSEEKHIRKKQCFDPSISINNTKLWLKDTRWDSQVRIVEKRLSGYLYDFPE